MTTQSPNISGLRLAQYQNGLVMPVAAAILTLATVFGVWFGLDQLDAYARIAFIVFGVAIIGWTMTNINNTYVALAAALTFTLLGIDRPTQFFETLADPIVWLLIAAFVISAGVSASGLSTRLTVLLTRPAKTVSQLFYLLTVVLILTAFMIPSTSGRAALMLPIFIALSQSIRDRQTVRALSLLFPTVILLSAVASLIGAGAHLVTVDLLWHLGFDRISFGRWMALGLPFALVSSFVSVWVLLRMFLTEEARNMPVQISVAHIDENYSPKWARREIYTALLLGGLILLWCTEAWHGVDNTVVAIVGALVVTAPKIGLVNFKTAIKAVNWTLILFMAATLKLGEALIKSGGADWIVQSIFGISQDFLAGSMFLTVILFALIALFSHMVITSRTARASVIIPLVILIATSLGLSVKPLAFLVTVGIGFCLTLTVSAKPVAMFASADERAYRPSDLLRFSMVLLPIHLALLILFSFFVWPQLGMAIAFTEPAAEKETEERPTAPIWIDEPVYESAPVNPLTPLLGLPLPTEAEPNDTPDPSDNDSGAVAPIDREELIFSEDDQIDQSDEINPGAERALPDESQGEAFEAGDGDVTVDEDQSVTSELNETDNDDDASTESAEESATEFANEEMNDDEPSEDADLIDAPSDENEAVENESNEDVDDPAAAAGESDIGADNQEDAEIEPVTEDGEDTDMTNGDKDAGAEDIEEDETTDETDATDAEDRSDAVMLEVKKGKSYLDQLVAMFSIEEWASWAEQDLDYSVDELIDANEPDEPEAPEPDAAPILITPTPYVNLPEPTDAPDEPSQPVDDHDEADHSDAAGGDEDGDQPEDDESEDD